MQPDVLLPSQDHHSSAVPGRIVLQQHFVATCLFEWNFLPSWIDQPDQLSCRQCVCEHSAEDRLQSRKLLSRWHHRRGPVSPGLCLQYACNQGRLHHAKLLPSQLDAADSVRSRVVLSECVVADRVSCQQLLPPGRDCAHHLWRLQLRPVHRVGVHCLRQHRVPCLHQPACQRGLYRGRKRSGQLSVGVQSGLLSQRRPVSGVPCRQLVQCQRAEHVPDQFVLCCTELQPEFVPVFAWIRWQWVRHRHKPVPHLQRWLLLPWWKQQRVDCMPCKLLISSRRFVVFGLPVRPRLPAREQRVMPAVRRGPDLSERSPQHLSSQFQCPPGLLGPLVVCVQPRLLRSQRRNVRTVPCQFVLPRRQRPNAVHCQRGLSRPEHQRHRVLL